MSWKKLWDRGGIVKVIISVVERGHEEVLARELAVHGMYIKNRETWDILDTQIICIPNILYDIVETHPWMYTRLIKPHKFKRCTSLHRLYYLYGFILILSTLKLMDIKWNNEQIQYSMRLWNGF